MVEQMYSVGKQISGWNLERDWNPIWNSTKSSGYFLLGEVESSGSISYSIAQM